MNINVAEIPGPQMTQIVHSNDTITPEFLAENQTSDTIIASALEILSQSGGTSSNFMIPERLIDIDAVVEKVIYHPRLMDAVRRRMQDSIHNAILGIKDNDGSQELARDQDAPAVPLASDEPIRANLPAINERQNLQPSSSVAPLTRKAKRRPAIRFLSHLRAFFSRLLATLCFRQPSSSTLIYKIEARMGHETTTIDANTLLDTGSPTSLVSRTYFEGTLAQYGFNLNLQQGGNRVAFQTMLHEDVKAIGTVTLVCFCVERPELAKRVEHEFLVSELEIPQYDMIIGQDVSDKHYRIVSTYGFPGFNPERPRIASNIEQASQRHEEESKANEKLKESKDSQKSDKRVESSTSQTSQPTN